MYGVNLITERQPIGFSLIDDWLTNRLHTIASPRAEATRGQTSGRLNLTGFPHASTATTNISSPVDPRSTTHKYLAVPLPS